MRLALRRGRTPSLRPAIRYVTLGAEQARRHGSGFVGTHHILLGMLRNPNAETERILRRLDVEPEAVEARLREMIGPGSPAIDADALATLGIDFDAVRQRLDASFGAGALERTSAGCLGIDPRAKMALAMASEHAQGRSVHDRDVLLGMLGVPDSPAASVLAEHGITADAMAAVDLLS
ncbi:MAG: Clp protease N-terminal domain-containing protein [Gaiellales bacterium]